MAFRYRSAYMPKRPQRKSHRRRPVHHQSGKPRPRTDRRVRRTRTRRPKAPRTADELFSLPDRDREQWEQVTRLVSRMRDEGVSLGQAARDAKVQAPTAIRLAGAALRKNTAGRYVPTSRDRLLRVLVIPTEDGSREIALRDSRQATEISHYFTALRRFLHTGDPSALRQFQRSRIKTVDGTVRLLTDVDMLKRLGNAGVLSFESIYGRR